MLALLIIAYLVVGLCYGIYILRTEGPHPAGATVDAVGLIISMIVGGLILPFHLLVKLVSKSSKTKRVT